MKGLMGQCPSSIFGLEPPLILPRRRGLTWSNFGKVGFISNTESGVVCFSAGSGASNTAHPRRPIVLRRSDDEHPGTRRRTPGAQGDVVQGRRRATDGGRTPGGLAGRWLRRAQRQ